jgi:hypothetical protein
MSKLLEICKDTFDPTTMPPDKIGICNVDMYLIIQWAKSMGVKKITEFGYGISSSLLDEAGFDRTSFSLDVSGGGKKHGVDKGKFVQCDLFDEAFSDQILESCKQSDLILVDCLHTWKMAKCYCENFLVPAKKPVAIHDMTGPHRKNIFKEQDYLDQHVIGKTFDVFAYTDLPGPALKALKKRLGVKFNHKRMSTLMLIAKE